mgnify:FL=1
MSCVSKYNNIEEMLNMQNYVKRFRRTNLNTSELRIFENILVVDHVLLLFFMYIELIGHVIAENFLVYILFNELLLDCV